MARRVVMGNIGGAYDLRISRRGHDAMTANVNDVRQISFSAQRAATARVGSAGEITARNTWKAFGKTYPTPPPVIGLLKRGSYVITDLYQEYPHPTGYLRGTPFCIVVQESRMMATNPTWYTGPNFNSDDRFIYYMLEADD